MKQISVTLKSFLNNHFKDINNDSFQLSYNSLVFIKRLYGYIIKSHLEWINNPFINEILVSSNDIPKGNNYNGIPNGIRDYIESSSQKVKIFVLYLNHRKIQVHFVYDEKSLIDEKTIRLYLQKMYMWLYVCNIYSPYNCANNLNIYLYLTDLKKKLPEKDLEPFDMEDANTGYTYSCLYNDINSSIKKTNYNVIELIIFREEEWFKVFIHETFHAMGLDFSSMDNSDSTKKIQNLFNIENVEDVRLYESYTEICAELIHSIFYVHFTVIHSKRGEDMEYTYAKIEETLRNEVLFSLFQSVKVLDHFGLTYEKLYDNSIESKAVCKNYRENTPVFSYYILKSILLFNLNNFIEWINTNNSGSFKFNHTNHTIEKYIHLIRDNYKNPKYTSSVKTVEKYFKKIKGNKKNEKELETLRMTLHEL